MSDSIGIAPQIDFSKRKGSQMRNLIIDGLREALDCLWEDDWGYAYHVGKAGGVAAAIGESGFMFEWFCDDISNAFEVLDLAVSYDDDFDPEGFEDASEYVVNREMNFEYLIKVLEEAEEDEDSIAPDISWEEYGVALNEAMMARKAGDNVRYALMIGFVSGLMFRDPGPRYEEGSILNAISRGYEKSEMERLRWAGARLAAGHRLSDPTPFMKKDAYDRYMEGKLRTMRWVQNFGLHAARRENEGVAVPTSMMINMALRQEKGKDK